MLCILSRVLPYKQGAGHRAGRLRNRRRAHHDALKSADLRVKRRGLRGRLGPDHLEAALDRAPGLSATKTSGAHRDLAAQAARRAGVGTGIIMRDVSSTGLGQALDRALKLYQETPEAMRQTITRGMGADVGWDASAAGYAALYHSLTSDV